MKKSTKLPKRNEIDKRYKWAIEDLYQTDEAWKEEFDQVIELSKKLENYKGKLSESSEILLDFFHLSDDISRLMERIYVYANQKSHEDTTNTTYQNLANQANGLLVTVESAEAFAIPEILEISDELLQSFLNQNEKLKKYEHYLQEVRRVREHILSSEMEELLANAGEMAESAKNIFSMFNNADIKFPEIEDENGEIKELSHGRYITFLESSDRRVRKEAFEAFNQTYGKYKNTLAATFSSNVKQEVFFASARKYPSTLAMALDDSNIPQEVYTNLIKTVHDNMNYMHRYVALRKKLLQVDELHMYDLYTPIVPNVKMKIGFEEAKEKVINGLSPLLEDYKKILLEGFNNGWIDVYENEGKRSGAYSWGAYGTHPYVLLNYQDNLNNVFTLAHEMGHAIHSYLSDEAQPIRYAGYKIFVAEVASTCNEALLMDYLLNQTKDKLERAYLINYYLEQFRTTLFRQTMFAEFEMITHKMVEEGESLTAEALCEIYHNLNVSYFGNDIVIDQDIDMEWARIPHFYNSFYVYQYATGYSAAIALSRKILGEGKPAVDGYINFLKGGSSNYPIELLKGAGVDMTTKEPINEALQLFGNLIDELEELLK